MARFRKVKEFALRVKTCTVLSLCRVTVGRVVGRVPLGQISTERPPGCPYNGVTARVRVCIHESSYVAVWATQEQ